MVVLVRVKVVLLLRWWCLWLGLQAVETRELTASMLSSSHSSNGSI